MSEGGDDDALRWQGPDDEYGQDLSREEEDRHHQEPNELQPFFEGESIIPGGIHRANESYLADDNILQMLADDKSCNPKTSRNQSTIKKKGVSKERTRKKHSLSKNRVNGKDSYVMRNTFEDLSNRMMAKSILTANSLQGSVRDTSNIAVIGARKPGVYKEPTTLSNLDHILISPNTGSHLKGLDLRYETTADCTSSSKEGHHHLAASEVVHKPNPVSQRKGPNFSLFSNLHIEKKASPVAPKTHFEIPMQMKTEVIRLRKTSEIDKEITDTINSKRNLHNQEKGPIRILKNLDQPTESNMHSSKERTTNTNTNLPPRSSLKKRRTAAPSKDVSIHDEESPDKDKPRRISGFSKGSIEKKAQQPVHHFKTIQEVLAQNGSNYQV